MKSGFVSLIGRPNAGKSTLLNRLVGTKVAIVSDKPQTTRTRIVGVRNYEQGQVVFVDTPGIHRPLHRMNVRMVDAAVDTMSEVDALALVVDATERPGGGDRYLLNLLRNVKLPVVCVLNKVDLIAKPKVLPLIEYYRQQYQFADFVPISAKDGTNIAALEKVLLDLLPEGEPLYPADYITDQPERVVVSETIREQVLANTHAELPFSTAVVVDSFQEPDDKGIMRLYCSILVERESQKGIIVGRAGEMIKTIGTAARLELERFFATKVFLDLRVKVKADWREDERLLDELNIRPDR